MKWLWFIFLLLLVTSVFAQVGCPGSSQVKVAAKSDDEYWLSFVNRDGVSYNVPFAEFYQGNLRYGRDSTRNFITQETDFNALVSSPTPEDAFNIGTKDAFLVNAGDTASSHVLEYESADVPHQSLVFEDFATGPKAVNFVSPAQGQDPAVVLGEFSLTVGGYTFKGYVMNSPSTTKGQYPLALDLNGDGAINTGTAYIVIRGNGVLDIGSNDGSGNGAVGSIPVSLSTPERNFRQFIAGGSEELQFIVSKKNNQVSVGNVAYYRNGVLRTPTSLPPFDLYSVSGSNNWYGATDYGMLIEYYKPSSVPEEITLDYPGMGPCVPQFSRPEATPTSVQVPASTSSNCQDSDGFDPYKKGTVSGLDSKGKTESVSDICQGSSGTRNDIVVEGICNDGKVDFLRFRCLNGCKDGACTPRKTFFNGVSWYCLDDTENHAVSGCSSEKALFEGARDFCAKNCKGLNCRIKSLELGDVCEPPKPQEKPQPEPKRVEKPVQCEGCIAEGDCVPFGTRRMNKIAFFCASNSEWLPQKSDKEPCQNGYECVSEQCVDGLCSSPASANVPEVSQKSWLGSVWGWFVKNLFH